MAVDDAMRLPIHRKLEELMGTEEADAPVSNWLPWQELVTKDDLRVLKDDLRVQSAELRLEMAGLRTELHQAIAAQTRWLVGFVAVWSGLMLAVARLAF